MIGNEPDTKQVCWVANPAITPGLKTRRIYSALNPNAYGGPNPFKTCWVANPKPYIESRHWFPNSNTEKTYSSLDNSFDN